jgi:hypothetical protein
MIVAEQIAKVSAPFYIICPEDGKNILFRGRCPKCGGDSWVPAGHLGGVVEQQSRATEDDDTEVSA